jgi:hypothetical protein
MEWGRSVSCCALPLLLIKGLVAVGDPRAREELFFVGLPMVHSLRARCKRKDRQWKMYCPDDGQQRAEKTMRLWLRRRHMPVVALLVQQQER